MTGASLRSAGEHGVARRSPGRPGSPHPRRDVVPAAPPRDAHAEFRAGAHPWRRVLRHRRHRRPSSRAAAHAARSRRPSPTAVGALGVGDGDQVVVYAGKYLVASARVWWTFRVFGHVRVAVLDGGFPRWREEGRPIETGGAEPGAPPLHRALHPELVTDLEAVRRNLDDAARAGRGRALGGTLRGDRARAPRGPPRRPHPRQPEPPYDRLFRPDGTLLGRDDLRRAFEAAHVDLERPIVTTCGSGVTACVLALGLDGSAARTSPSTTGPGPSGAAGTTCPSSRSACRASASTSIRSTRSRSSTSRGASTRRSSRRFPPTTFGASTGPSSSPAGSTSACCRSSGRDGSAPIFRRAGTRRRSSGASIRCARPTGSFRSGASGPRTSGAAGRSTTSSCSTPASRRARLCLRASATSRSACRWAPTSRMPSAWPARPGPAGRTASCSATSATARAPRGSPRSP